MNIHSTAPYPADEISNFAHHPFVFDGVECQSMEGLLQSFKFRSPARQLSLCKAVGLDAKYAGRAGNGWLKTQMLWWNDVEYDRHSKAYYALLVRAYEALAQNAEFRKALTDTGCARLTHSFGEDDPEKTILTKEEFVSLLTSLRASVVLGLV